MQQLREYYEKESDLIKEARVREFLSNSKNVNVEKPNAAYQVDCVGYRKDETREVLWFGEIKCRNNSFERYPTLIISLLKIERGRTLAAAAHKPFYVFVQYENGKVYEHRLRKDEEYLVTYDGRTVHTRHQSDIEPVIHIPTSQLIEVHGNVKLPKFN
jgi:hypothetical protein